MGIVDKVFYFSGVFEVNEKIMLCRFLDVLKRFFIIFRGSERGRVSAESDEQYTVFEKKNRTIL